ncbi:hypothetical protein VCR6J2_610211 [Vibrio coralliirubri]|nr:hypothetical protein VCR1J2_20136 [Vibrio coralliirubri]CDT60249.1 hypothetical protein VCR6J2_610211 [Vibrio coralliirubri]CDT83998.1 hypothetical protein VCR8J2_240140 [Vibrio coralliirubri]
MTMPFEKRMLLFRAESLSGVLTVYSRHNPFCVTYSIGWQVT